MNSLYQIWILDDAAHVSFHINAFGKIKTPLLGVNGKADSVVLICIDSAPPQRAGYCAR